MATKEEKKNQIRTAILDAAEIYSSELAGKTFLYVYGDKYFELWFSIESYPHLTGVNSHLSAEDFYKKCLERKLTCSQFYFDKKHRYDNAKKKLSKLKDLPLLTNQMVCVIEDLKTVTFTYKIGITDLNFTLALTENIDFEGKLINNWWIPRSLRIKDKSIEQSSNGGIVDFIFWKKAEETKYSNIAFIDKNKTIPLSIKDLLLEDLYNQFE